MRRKLVKQGSATMMISLPSKWIKENKLGKGDEVELEEQKKELVISIEEKRKEQKTIEINLNNENINDLRVLLTHSYRKGYNKIILKGNLAESKKEISKIVPNVLLGFEITERNQNKIVIENISQPDKSKYSVMISKIFLLINEMPEIVLNNPSLNELEQTKDSCDKFVLFCRKIITEGKINQDPILEWEFLTFLTHIQHTYYYLGKYLLENKLTKDTKLINLLKESQDYFSLLEKSYLKKDLNFIHQINKKKTKYQFGKCLELIEKSKTKQAVVASYIRELFRLIQIGSSPILTEILNKNS